MADCRGVVGVSILGNVVIAGNFDGDRMPHGLAEFLAIPLTVKNVLLLALSASSG
jgi:hypothetical protein